MLLPLDYLTSVSSYFEKAFNGQFRESKEKTLQLDDTLVNEATLAVFAEWLHGRKLLNSDGQEYDGEKDGEKDDEMDKKKEEKPRACRYDELISLYILGDACDIPQLRRDVLDTLIKYAAEYPRIPGEHNIASAYAQLPANSPMLQALVDIWAEDWTGGPDGDPLGSQLPQEFLFNTTKQLCLQKCDTNSRV